MMGALPGQRGMRTRTRGPCQGQRAGACQMEPEAYERLTGGWRPEKKRLQPPGLWASSFHGCFVGIFPTLKASKVLRAEDRPGASSCGNEP